MTLYNALLVFVNEKEVSGSVETVVYYQSNLLRFLQFLSPDGYETLPCSALTLLVVQNYVKYLRQERQIKNVSINTYLRAIRCFVNWLFDNGFLDTNFSRYIRYLRNDKENIVPLYANEVDLIDSLFSDSSETALRDKCIFHLMLDCGLRSGEVIRLKISNLMFDKNVISVLGKGSKYRLVIMPPNVKTVLFKYLVFYRGYKPSSIDDSPVFVQLTKDRQPMTENAIKMLFSRLKKRSGVSRVYPHLCRHTFATSYIMGGGNLEFLRLLMGHSSYTITQNYLHLAGQFKMLGADIYKLDSVFFKTLY